VLEQIQRAFEDELVEPFMIQWSDVEEAASLGSEGVIERLRRQGFHLIIDVVKEMEWWACFGKEPSRKGGYTASSAPLSSWPAPPVQASSSLAPQTPRRRTLPKVGRNDPCPCGSGKKYKKCCGA
jgi:preprotein translocase subunit SecA